RALAARRSASRRYGDAGYAILLHVDVAEHCKVTTLSFGLQLAHSDSVAQQGITVPERIELDRIKIERHQRRRRNRLDLDIASAALDAARGKPHDEQRARRAGRERAHAQAPGVLMVPSNFLSLSDASLIPSVSV